MLTNPPIKLFRPQEAPSSESADISIGQSSEQVKTGYCDSANPPPLPDPSVAATDVRFWPPACEWETPCKIFHSHLYLLQELRHRVHRYPKLGNRQQPPQLVDGVFLVRQPFSPSPTSPTPNALFSADITAIASANINPAPVIVRDVLPALPVLPASSAAVLPAIPKQSG